MNIAYNLIVVPCILAKGTYLIVSFPPCQCVCTAPKLAVRL